MAWRALKNTQPCTIVQSAHPVFRSRFQTCKQLKVAKSVLVQLNFGAGTFHTTILHICSICAPSKTERTRPKENGFCSPFLACAELVSLLATPPSNEAKTRKLPKTRPIVKPLGGSYSVLEHKSLTKERRLSTNDLADWAKSARVFVPLIQMLIDNTVSSFECVCLEITHFVVCRRIVCVHLCLSLSPVLQKRVAK